MSKTTRRVYKIAAAAAFTAGSVAAIPATFAAEAPANQQQQVVEFFAKQALEYVFHCALLLSGFLARFYCSAARLTV